MSARIEDIAVPDSLRRAKVFSNVEELDAWEDEAVALFSEHASLFTPYPEYFRTRRNELLALRHLLPEAFGCDARHSVGLEMGCGYGFLTLLMARAFDRLVGVDIPEKYEGYVRGDYDSPVDIARVVVCDLFERENVELHAAWPASLKMVESGSVSLLFSAYVLEHIPDLPAAVDEMSRVVCEGGMMVHVVPNTSDTVVTWLNAQLALSGKRLAVEWFKEMGRKLVGRGTDRIRLNGLVVPPCHSEHARDYEDQLRIYSLENFLFPMLDRGFSVERILSTGEYNRVLVMRKGRA